MIFFAEPGEKLVILAPKIGLQLYQSTDTLKTLLRLNKWKKVNRPSYSNLASILNLQKVFTVITCKLFGLNYPSLAWSKCSVIFFVINYHPDYNILLFSFSVQRDLLSYGRSPDIMIFIVAALQATIRTSIEITELLVR